VSRAIDEEMRRNSPIPVGPVEKVLDRIKSKVRIEGDCWTWTASCNSGGAPQMWWHRTMHNVRGLAWDAARSDARPPWIKLVCENPLCVNPDHMARRMHGPNKGHHRETCPQGHLYSEHGVLQSDGSHRCRLCRREIQQRKRAKRRA
jgi:hypothetical protein